MKRPIVQDPAAVEQWTPEQFAQWGESFRRRFVDLLKTQRGGDVGGTRHGSPEWFERVKTKLRENGVANPTDEHVRTFQIGVETHDQTWRTRAERVGTSLFEIAGLEPLRVAETEPVVPEPAAPETQPVGEEAPAAQELVASDPVSAEPVAA